MSTKTLSDTKFKIVHGVQNTLKTTASLHETFNNTHDQRINYPVGDPCRHFTILTWSSVYYTLHSNLIPSTDGTNSLFM